jgi:hypothetical protein
VILWISCNNWGLIRGDGRWIWDFGVETMDLWVYMGILRGFVAGYMGICDMGCFGG